MSLINQMLQELDARRSDLTGSETYGQQVRAVPDRRRIHPAWWVALALAIVSAALLAWVLLRPPVVQVAAPASAQLPLKFDAKLGADGPAAATAVASAEVPVQPMEKKDGQSATDMNSQPEVPPAAMRSDAVPISAADKNMLAVQAPEPSRPAKAAQQPLPATESVKPAPTEKPSARIPPAATADQARPEPVGKQIRELSPQQRTENEYRGALLAIQQGRLNEAIAMLERALELDARHAGARQALIGALLDSKRHDDALRVTREGLAQDPAQPGLAMILARLQLERGELRSAIETLERSLRYAEDRADYQAFLAALLQKDQRHKQAVEHYLQAVRLTPQNGTWWMGLGISFQADNRLPEAQEAFRRAKASNTLTPELLAFVEGRLRELQR